MKEKEFNEMTEFINYFLEHDEVIEEIKEGDFNIGYLLESYYKKADYKEMDDLKNKYFITIIGGKTVVVKRDDFSSQMSFSDFSRFYSNLREHLYVPKGNDKTYSIKEIPIVERFLNNEAERFEKVVFKPSSPVNEGEYNYFKGWVYEPKDNGKCNSYLQHIRDNICSGDKELYNYVLDWMAHIVQFPEKKVDKAIVLRGNQGTGKGFMVQEFGSLFGATFHQLTSIGPLIGRFNSELANRLLVFADEITWGGKKSEGSRLKTFISEKSINIELKGKDAISMNNFARLIIASNHDWVVPVEAGDRRYVIIDVNDNCKEDKKYFSKIHNDMTNGGREDLMYFLLDRDLSKRDWSIIPQSKARDEQKLLTLDPHESWLYESLNGDITLDKTPWEKKGFGNEIPNNHIHERYKDYMKDNHPGSHIKNSREISTFLTKKLGLITTKKNGITFKTFPHDLKEIFQNNYNFKSDIWD